MRATLIAFDRDVRILILMKGCGATCGCLWSTLLVLYLWREQIEVVCHGQTMHGVGVRVLRFLELYFLELIIGLVLPGGPPATLILPV